MAEYIHAESSHLAITYRSPASLKSCPGNPRRHSEKQIKQVARSIKTFGFSVPVLTDGDGKILAGHCRVQAALKLGMQEIPTISIAYLTAEQAKAFMIADNRLSELSNWDDNLLAGMLRDLSEIELDFNIENIGFTLDDIELRIELANTTQADVPDPDDQLPPAPEHPVVSKLGDVWLLGEHRLLHGDATKLSDIETLMAGKRATMTFTDPPYGVDYANSAKDKIRGKHRPILNDNLGDAFGNFLDAACANILSVTDGGIYICMSSSALHTLQGAFAKAGGHWSTFIIWAKQTFTLGRADYQRQYEPILYGWREGTERHWCGARDQGDVWSINKPVKNDLHPTMKPVALVMRAIRNSSQRKDIIFDPFLGSGSSLIAAERTGRVCFGVELDGRHVDTAICRWQRHTGDQAIHAANGQTFHDVAVQNGGSHE